MEYIHTVKAAIGADDLIEGIGIPFGGPLPGGKDLYNEAFTKSTELALGWYDARPLLYDHGTNQDAGITKVGTVKAWKLTDIGLWTQSQLDSSSEYFEAIKELIAKKKLFFSSGTLDYLYKVNKKTGEILQWPWAELSLTTHPANIFAKLDFATAEKHYASIGARFFVPASYKAELDAKERDHVPDDDFAYVDSDGHGHLPIENPEHIRAALSRFDQTDFPDAATKKTAAQKILAAAKRHDIDVGDDDPCAMAAKSFISPFVPKSAIKAVSFEQVGREAASQASNRIASSADDDYGYCYPVATYADSAVVCYDGDDNAETFYRVPFTLDGDGHVAGIGYPTPVDPDWSPRTAINPISSDAKFAASVIAAFAQRTKDLSARRASAGRLLSTASRATVTDFVTTARKALDTLTASLDQTAPPLAEAKASASDTGADPQLDAAATLALLEIEGMTL